MRFVRLLYDVGMEFVSLFDWILKYLGFFRLLRVVGSDSESCFIFLRFNFIRCVSFVNFGEIVFVIISYVERCNN